MEPTLMLVLKTGMRERQLELSRPTTGSGLCLEAVPPIPSDCHHLVGEHQTLLHHWDHWEGRTTHHLSISGRLGGFTEDLTWVRSLSD